MTVAVLDRVTSKRGPRTVLDDVSLRVEAGERVGIVGPNGAGKTTLLRTLLALDTPISGSVIRTGGAGYVPQAFAESLFPWFSVLRNVAMPRLVAHLPDAFDVARRLCERLLPGVDPARLAGRLSGGEKQATAIARALASSGDLLVADEPFSAISADARARVRRVLREELGGRALVLVSHAIDDVRDLCERVVRVDDACLVDDAAHGASP